MTSLEYGPVPISRIKEEAGRLFDALQEGRRVSISRRGRVVAVIEPASLEKHAHELAEYALQEETAGIMELSASQIGQGSPSEYVRNAEAGQLSWVTRSNKVYGILQAVPSGVDANLIDMQEEALKRFEREHPDATAEEFADAAERLSFDASPIESADPVLLDALQERAHALDLMGNDRLAEEEYQAIISRFGQVSDRLISQRVAGSMVELAKLYNREERPDDAIAVLDRVISRLQELQEKVEGRLQGVGSGRRNHNVEPTRSSY